jgi:multidrug efflux pump
MKNFNLSEWALDHRSFTLYLMIVFLAAGVFSYLKLGRGEDPAYAFKVMVLNVKWPGATTEETILQITDRIEWKLQELQSLDFIKSETKPGDATIYIYLKDSTPKDVVSRLWYQVRKKVADIAATLPEGVQGPFFNDEFGDTFSLVYAFTADGFTQRDLRDYVSDIRASLLSVPNTQKVNILGAQDERIYIEFDTRKLAGLGLDRIQAVESLRAQNAVAPAGVVTNTSDRIVLWVGGAFASTRSLRDVNLYISGRFYRLSDVATVRRGYVDPPQPTFRFGGQPAIGLAVAMSPGADVLQFGRDIRQKIAEITADLPIGIDPHLVSDQPAIVKQAVGHFLEALWAAIAIVLAVTFFSLGLRAGAVVALSIPLVLAIVFAGMKFGDIALQRISLGALVISLGLLVDDAMIAIEMMVSRLELGSDRRSAATHAYRTTAFPMLTGTLVTIAGFVPVGFARSDSGEYLFSLFVVVTLALIVSWVVAVFFAPLFGVMLLREDQAAAGTESRRIRRFSPLFRRFLVFCLRHKYTVIAATAAAFMLSILGATRIEQQFFPSSDRRELVVDLRLPQSASIYQTQAVANRFEKLLEGDPDIERYTMHIGEGAPRFYLALNVSLADDFLAQAIVVTRGLAEREAVRARLELKLREEFPEVLARVQPLQLGPLVEWPIQYRVSGPDVSTLRRLGYQLSRVIADNPDVRNVNFDWMEPIRAIRLHVDQAKARQVGLSSTDLAQALNAVTSGLVITQIRDDVYLIDVVARGAASDRNSLDAIRGLQIQLKGNQSIQLSDLASFEYTLDRPVIWRRNRVPTITVQADVTADVQPETVNQQLTAGLAEFARQLPTGYRLAAGGTIEASDSSLQSVLDVLPVMLILMLTVLMAQLQSFGRLLLVISVAPLGLIGVAAIMLATRMPMGFVAILGVIALTGMIIRNSVILVDQIQQNVTAGQAGWDAVVNASVHRFRPILLTAAAAMLGMLPIARDVFWGPMAVAIIGGLAGGTLLTLIFLPALYIICFGIKERADSASMDNRSRC